MIALPPHFVKKDVEMEVKPNTGMLMKNTRKTDEKHPDYTGTWVDEQGVECYLDAWKNTSKAGNPYLKLRKGKPRMQAQGAPASAAPYVPAKQPAPAAAFESDDDIPF